MRTHQTGSIPAENLTIHAVEIFASGVKLVELTRDKDNNILSLSVAEAKDLIEYVTAAIRFLEREQ